MVMPCGFESHLSHQKLGYPLRDGPIFIASDGTRKGGTSPQTGVKTVRETFSELVEEFFEFKMCTSRSDMFAAVPIYDFMGNDDSGGF